MSGYGFMETERSFGLVHSIQAVGNWAFEFDNMFLGLGLSRANFVNGEGGGMGYGTTLALEYNPFQKIVAPKVNIWITGNIFFLGGNLGLSGVYYLKDDKTNFVLRPEIGIGLIKVFLNYGYNFFLDTRISSIEKHTLTLSYYHTIYPWKEKKK